MTPRRGVVSIVVVPMLLLAVACSSSKNTSTGATTAGSGGPEVVAKDIAYSPTTLSVKPGDTVTFSNKDNTTHTFTADAGSFDSGRLSPGKSSTFVVPATATSGTAITFHCQIHSSMKGSLTVA
jgi:plastocyanin